MSIKNLLTKAQKAYMDGKPFMDDDTFDALAKRYNFYEVGASPNHNRGEHLFRMYSLQKVFEGEDKVPQYTNVCTTSKLDGAAISLLYVHGLLVQGLTRGNGIEGEDITDKVLLMDSIPNVINNSSSSIQITGEVVASKDIENSRNYASGSLHLKDLDEFLNREIFFIAYNVEPFITESYVTDMQTLNTLSFNTVVDDDWSEYPQDGIVFRCISNAEYLRLGYTAKHPRGAYALKKRSDVAIEEATLLEVKWQVGKGGKITPVAIFTEVVIEDAKINRATLHNIGFIEEMELAIGDTILITRSGGIIPKVVGKL